MKNIWQLFVVICLGGVWAAYQQSLGIGYVANGDFSTPSLSANSALADTATNWTGHMFTLQKSKNLTGTVTQFLNLKSNLTSSSPSYIQQQITLPHTGPYLLTYTQKAYNYSLTPVMRVYWNGGLVASGGQNGTMGSQSVEVGGVVGGNLLRFQVGGGGNWGVYLDTVSLVQVVSNATNTTNTTNTTAATNTTNISTNTSTTTTNTSTSTSNSTTNTTTTQPPTNTTTNNNTNTTTNPTTTNTTTQNTTNSTTPSSNITQNPTTNQTTPSPTTQNSTNITNPTPTQNTTNSNINTTSNITGNGTNGNYTGWTGGVNGGSDTVGVDGGEEGGVGAGGSVLGDVATTAAGILFSLPVNRAPSLRFVYIFVADIWLYNYDDRQYQGILNDTFDTITAIEQVKFQAFQKYIGWAHYATMLPISNYTNSSLPKFVQIEGSESMLIKSNFTFFIYSIPQNILVCLLLYLLFMVLSRYRVSKYLRSFYFVKTVLGQTLVEGNLAYFVYVCFSQMGYPYFYGGFDRVAFGFTVFVLFGLTIFAFTFYILVGCYLKQQSSYFIYCCYRFNPSFYLLTLKNLVRSFLQGSAHYFLFSYYGHLMLALSLVQLLTLAIIITAQTTQNVFMFKSMFCRDLVYHFIFVVLNATLYFDYLYGSDGTEERDELRGVILEAQRLVVLLYCVVLVVTIVLDLLPGRCLRKRDLMKELLQECLDQRRKQFRKMKKIHKSNSNHQKLTKQKRVPAFKPQNLPKFDNSNQKISYKIEQLPQNISIERLSRMAQIEKKKQKKPRISSKISEFKSNYSPRENYNLSIYSK